MLPTYFDQADMQSPISIITSLNLSPPLGLAPMAGMTDTAFRRLVKRHGDCALVVTEMVSSEGLVRGIGRTLEYAEYTEEERPVAIQIFGGDPDRMASAARIVESMGADIVDVNMGCPVPKIAKHNAGCSLMRKPDHAARVVQAMTKAVRIPVTVKMRAGWSEEEINAPVVNDLGIDDLIMIKELPKILAEIPKEKGFVGVIISNALHGPFGEDGQAQKILKKNKIPFSHSNIKSSNLCFNKSASKREIIKNKLMSPKFYLLNINLWI